LALVFAANAGKMLVVNSPQASDLIVVLAGETNQRPALALDLLHRGYAPKILLDVPANTTIYDRNIVQVAEEYVQHRPESAQISICPIRGLSTREESREVATCASRENVTRILIVTSDYHTRRALSIFRHEVHGKSFSVAAAQDPAQFGVHWWTHRQWAKVCLDEWLRSLWWNVVERWL
jgi:uncharacterized SAM-binding protein YcdF (DUF218 family)